MERHDEQLRVADNAASRTIATILRHDRKQNSYKLALIRAINDVVLSFPDAGTHEQPVAIPLRSWIARPLRAIWLDFLEDRMTRKIYDKLVRDRIPEIIRQSGSTCGTEMFEDDDAFRRALLDKLVEEAIEAAAASGEDLPGRAHFLRHSQLLPAKARFWRSIGIEHLLSLTTAPTRELESGAIPPDGGSDVFQNL
jgi:hypothetical protein